MAVVTELRCSIMPDDFADASYLEQEGFEERKAAYERVEFCLVGVCAEATICFEGEHDAKSGVTHLRSPGVWGVEDDCPDYIDDIYREELTTLRAMLDEMGVTYAPERFSEAAEEGANL